MSSINGTNIERMRVNNNEIALAKINGNVVFQKNKLLKTFYGDSKQDTTSGKNIFNVNDGSIYWDGCLISIKNNILKIKMESIGNGGITQQVITDYTDFNFDINENYYFSLTLKSGSYQKKSTTDTTYIRPYIKYEDGSTSYLSISLNENKFLSTKIKFTDNKKPIAYAFGVYSPYGTIANNSQVEYFVQIEKGSTATKYEPYTGGKPSPNPDYPQKISSINGVNLKISNGSKELKIPINLQGNILAKVGDYADELQIYSNGDVNLVKKIREYKMTGNEDITYVHNNNLFDYQQFFDDVPYITGSGLCNYYRYNSVQSGINETMVHGEFALQNWSDGAWHKYNLMFKNTNYNNASNFKNHLAELYLTGTPVKVYYPRANSITTKIQNIKEELNSFGDFSNIEIETTYN